MKAKIERIFKEMKITYKAIKTALVYSSFFIILIQGVGIVKIVLISPYDQLISQLIKLLFIFLSFLLVCRLIPYRLGGSGYSFFKAPVSYVCYVIAISEKETFKIIKSSTKVKWSDNIEKLIDYSWRGKGKLPESLSVDFIGKPPEPPIRITHVYDWLLDFLFSLPIFLKSILLILALIITLLLSIAYLTLNERKIIGSMQKRIGPANVGFYGLLQPIADGLKLFIKEPVLPSNSNIIIFLIAPILTFILSLISWAVIPFNKYIVFADIEFGILYIFAISSLAVYGIIISGWASNSKYAFLGALRSTAQMISYEVSIGLILIGTVLCVSSLNLNKIIIFQENIWLVVPFFPLFIMFFISILAETNRHPFDLPEAEAELVAGYNVEYSSMGFALFFIGEYGNIILMSTLTVIIFLGGWLPPFSLSNNISFLNPFWFALKVNILLFAFLWVRAALPRYRYDQLMSLGWKILLPLSLGTLVLISSALISFL